MFWLGASQLLPPKEGSILWNRETFLAMQINLWNTANCHCSVGVV